MKPLIGKQRPAMAQSTPCVAKEQIRAPRLDGVHLAKVIGAVKRPPLRIHKRRQSVANIGDAHMRHACLSKHRAVGVIDPHPLGQKASLIRTRLAKIGQAMSMRS